MKKFFTAFFSVIFINFSIVDVNLFKKYFINYEKKYIIYITKEQKKLFLIDSDLKIQRIYTIAIGLEKGAKLHSGDNRSPEGEYKILQILSYKKPKYIIEKEKILNEKHDIKKIKEIIGKFEEGKRQLKKMNNVYLRAKDGHKRFGSEEDLGYNSYGPVFIRINYPNEEDKKRYKEAIKKGIITNDKKIGFGIAIHGTNDNASLGHSASSGCIRMNNKDIEELLDYIEDEMKVIIE